MLLLTLLNVKKLLGFLFPGPAICDFPIFFPGLLHVDELHPKPSLPLGYSEISLNQMRVLENRFCCFTVFWEVSGLGIKEQGMIHRLKTTTW